MDDKFDELLMTVAAQSGGVEGLLKTFFGFLNRRTDFYALIPDNVAEPKMGFRPGAAEALVSARNAFLRRLDIYIFAVAGQVLQELSIQGFRGQHRVRSEEIAPKKCTCSAAICAAQSDERAWEGGEESGGEERGGEDAGGSER